MKKALNLAYLSFILTLSWIINQSCTLPLIFDDSVTYLNWSWYRNLGYPVFLKVASLITNIGENLVFIQLFILFVSLFLLLTEIYNISRSKSIVIILFLSFLISDSLFFHQFKIMSESIFISSLVFSLSFFIRSLRTKAKADLFFLSLSCFVSYTIRPSGLTTFVYILIIVTILILEKPRQKSSNTCYVILPYIALLGTLSLFNNYKYQTYSINIRSGSALLAATSIFIDKETCKDYSDFTSPYVKPINREKKSIDNWIYNYKEPDKIINLTNNFSFSLKQFSPFLLHKTNYSKNNLNNFCQKNSYPSPICQDKFDKKLALCLIKSHAFSYAKLVANNFIGSFNSIFVGSSYHNEIDSLNKRLKDVSAGQYINRNWHQEALEKFKIKKKFLQEKEKKVEELLPSYILKWLKLNSQASIAIKKYSSYWRVYLLIFSVLLSIISLKHQNTNKKKENTIIFAICIFVIAKCFFISLVHPPYGNYLMVHEFCYHILFVMTAREIYLLFISKAIRNPSKTINREKASST